MTTTRREAPSAGSYEGTPWDVYASWDAVSNTELGQLARSPAHLRAYRTGVRPDDTDAQAFGRQLHTAVLEPAAFGRLYKRGPVGDLRTKGPREKKRALEEEFPDATILRYKDYDRVLTMRDRLRAHPTVARCLDQAPAERRELSLTWDESAITVCKGRLDIVTPELILDIKKAADGSPRGFARAVVNYGYARQAAQYLAGARAVWEGGAPDMFAFAVIEDEPPFEVAIYTLDAAALDYGRRERAALLRQYEACFARDEWPGYADQTISLPAWARAQYAEQQEAA